jgi:Xaa-Pro dipeptidase
VDFHDCVVVYDIGRDDLRLFVPENTTYKVIWMGATPSIEECKERYDVDHVSLIFDIESYLVKWVHSTKGASIYALHESQSPPFSTAGVCVNDWRLLKRLVNVTKLQPAMDAARVIKSDHELQMIREANKISGKAHVNVLRGIKKFTNESQVEAVFEATCVADNAKHQAYAIIAASGSNASVLHYGSNDEPLAGRQLLCIDAGCEWQCYASDVTRTFPISGKYTLEAKQIYDLVEEMQESCIERIKPGLVYHDLHELAHEIALKGLIKLGILHNGTEEEIRDSGATIAFFPHGVSRVL